MRFLRALVVVAMLLAGCADGSAVEAASADDLAGTYVRRDSDTNIYLLLVSDGRGATIAEQPTGEWTMLMTFDWSLEGDKFLQTQVGWTTDGEKFYQSHDDSTPYRRDGHAFATRIKKTGEWVRWEPTETDIFEKASKAISVKFPSQQ
ncbi:hypothetical protein ACW7GZ_14700 [Luteimonas sp. A537]